MSFINHPEWLTVTVNLNDENGKKFAKKLNDVQKHVMAYKTNEILGYPFVDYTVHEEDYDKCHDLFEMQKFVSVET